MTLARIVLPPSPAARAVIIAAVSVAILAAVWILQGLGIQPCELCLTQRYAFYAAAPLALLTAFAASRSGRGLARSGFVLLAVVFTANAALAAYHAGVEYHWWAGPTACTGGLTGSLDVNDLAKALEFGQGRALRRSPVAHRRTVARRVERSGQRRARRLRGDRHPALTPAKTGFGAHALLAPALEGFLPTPEMPEIADAEALMSRLSEPSARRAPARRIEAKKRSEATSCDNRKTVVLRLRSKDRNRGAGEGRSAYGAAGGKSIVY